MNQLRGGLSMAASLFAEFVDYPNIVIPAKAGTHVEGKWVPAFAGMTRVAVLMSPLSLSALLLTVIACASSVRQAPNPPVPAAAATSVAAQQGAARADTNFVMPPRSQFTRMTSGLMYYDVSLGTGMAAVDLREVEVHYVGKLENGTVFDSSREKGVPIKFVLAAGKVIPGWDVGIRGMRAGGRRILIIPPALAYGADGFPPVIPANATLTFDLTLVSVR